MSVKCKLHRVVLFIMKITDKKACENILQEDKSSVLLFYIQHLFRKSITTKTKRCNRISFDLFQSKRTRTLNYPGEILCALQEEEVMAVTQKC